MMDYEEYNRYVHDYEDSGQPIPSTKIGYDNTDSGLNSVTVQGAIDEVAQILDEKQDKTYDGTESGIEANTVTGAIDELAQNVSDLTDIIESDLPYYIIKKVERNKSIATLENKTFNDLFNNNELYTIINDYVHTLNDNERIKITGISFGGYTDNIMQETSLLLSNSDTLPILHLFENTQYSDAIHNRSIKISSSGSYFYDAVISTSTGTITVNNNTAGATSVNSVAISYELYEYKNN